MTRHDIRNHLRSGALTAISLFIAGSVLTRPAYAVTAAAQPVCASASEILPQEVGNNSAERACIDVVFILDTTGSMADLIDGMKLKIWAIANQILLAEPKPYVRFGLVAYRDRGDAYVTQHVALTDSLDAFYAALLGFQAQGGGDTPESVNQALYEGVTAMNWDRSGGTLRLAFLAGDAPPHMDYDQDVPYTDVLQVARQHDITVNALQAGSIPTTDAIWQEIARLGGGYYAHLPQSGGSRQIHTPFDDKIRQLQQELHRTAIPYGDVLERESYEESLSGIAAAPAPVAADRSAALYASEESALVTGQEDLIDQLSDGSLAVDGIETDLLPEALQDLDDEALSQHIAEAQATRAAIQAEIADLTRQRLAYIEENEEVTQNSFDFQVAEMLRSLAADKGFRYETVED